MRKDLIAMASDPFFIILQTGRIRKFHLLEILALNSHHAFFALLTAKVPTPF